MLKGLKASDGIAIGKAYKFELPKIEISDAFNSIEEELKKFDSALEKTIEDIKTIKLKASDSLNKDELAIFDAYLTLADDPELTGEMRNSIKNNSLSAIAAADYITKEKIALFEKMENVYFKERVFDIKDFVYRLECNILGLDIPDLTSIDEDSIIITEELLPSNAVQMNRKHTLGFISETGGKTSHAAIVAAGLGIPAVIGCNNIMETCNNNDIVVLDANEGKILINPSKEEIEDYKKKIDLLSKEKEELKPFLNKETKTADGHKIALVANISSSKEIEDALNNGAEGVGLLRSEFLYLKDHLPSEDEQFEVYKNVLEKANGKRVVIRTLDVGGDKDFSCLTFENETNPFLGYRAIRLCLDKKEIFKDQIRALLRASAYGKLAIMFPMITTIDEFKEAKGFVLREKDSLTKEGIKIRDDIEIGMMVETPAAALLAEEFGKYADFFSIGTNDLIQYTMAADRTSNKVSYLYQPLNPSILRLIKMAIDGAHVNGKWCAICGEMASDISSISILIGLGIDELSMTSSKILLARKFISSLKNEEVTKLANMAIKCQNQKEVIELVDIK